MPAVSGSTSRSYVAPRRQAAALKTRRRIRTAATELFLGQGYAATSMRAVAAAAGVAEKTVYLQYETKTALLKEVVETAIVGDDDELPVAARGWFVAVLEERDPELKLQRIVDGTADLHERTGPVFSIARGAAMVDPDVAQLWAAGKQGHRIDMGRLAASLAEAQMIPDGRDLAWAATVLYVVIGLETWHLVRVELDYGPDGYRAWLLDTLRQTFTGAHAQHLDHG
ncbi:MAG: TetR/AcrR family transcriptional regulator [Actinomycetota bacterium]|nr:TetR/AcrR family transcriptional regulator [Actinomycetota bacterium]